MMGSGGSGGRQIYIDEMFNLGGAAVTVPTAMNAGITTTGTGTYSPKANGFLLELYISIVPQAASSLAQTAQFAFSCTSWTPVNTLNIPASGFGIATAPQLYGGTQAQTRYTGLNLPVQTANAINGTVNYLYSPVTPYATVVGKFSC